MRRSVDHESRGWKRRENPRVRTSIWIEPVLVFTCSLIIVLIVINLLMPEPRWDQAASDDFIDRFRDHGMAVFQVEPADHQLVLSSLEGVDRQALLREVFELLTQQAESNSQKQMAVLSFLRSFGSQSEVAQDNGQKIVNDPLVLLMSRQATPRQMAMLTADLFAAADYPTRVVDTGHTWCAEVFYDDSWHFIDGSSEGIDGETVLTDMQSIPSFEELSKHSASLDARPHGVAPTVEGDPRSESLMSRSSLYYSPAQNKTQKDGRHVPVYVEKVGIGRRGDPTFGWEHEGRDSVPELGLGSSSEVRYQPGVPRWLDIQIRGNLAELRWEEPKDEDGDLRGYRVFVRSFPRGWNYRTFLGASSAQSYWHPSEPWTKEMKASLFQVPQEQIEVLTTNKPEIDIELPPDRPVYVTIMPFDEYHDACGRELYPMSNEVRITREQSKD